MYFFTFSRYEKCSFACHHHNCCRHHLFQEIHGAVFFTAQLVKQKSIHCLVNDIALYPLHQWMGGWALWLLYHLTYINLAMSPLLPAT